ncbi:MAG: hypothetical protein WKF30_06940 [Pyrinomonadaceae bacterium]
MRPVTRYSLVNFGGSNQRAVLARDSRAVTAEVEGVILEAQFELSDGCVLILMTDDSPYDEGLHVYLLEQDDSIEDALEAGAIFGMGSPGILKIAKTGMDWVEFEFFLNGSVYRLEVVRQARLRLRLPMGWRYKKLLSRHRLMVRAVQKGGN